jgi:hypothetical protein
LDLRLLQAHPGGSLSGRWKSGPEFRRMRSGLEPGSRCCVLSHKENKQWKDSGIQYCQKKKVTSSRRGVNSVVEHWPEHMGPLIPIPSTKVTSILTDHFLAVWNLNSGPHSC